MLQVTRARKSSFEATFSAKHFDHAATPAELRELAARLVSSQRLHDAVELIFEGLKKHPESEDLLVMHALLSEVQHNWTEASKTLKKLVAIQGKGVTTETWKHLVRVLRCAGDMEGAFQANEQALKHAPNDSFLVSEYLSLEAILELKIKASA